MNKNKTQETESTLVASVESPLMAATESPLMIAAELVKANGNMDVSKLKELLELQERYDATQAKKVYVVAMAAFKKKPPKIIKDKDNKQYGSKYASLGNVTAEINGALSANGLSSSWRTGTKENGWPEVTCTITHIGGHSESTSLSAPPDDSGKKNPIQKIVSTVSYLKRETLLSLTGLATYDQDDDGNASGAQTESKPTKKEEQNKLVEHAFFEFETANQPYLNEHPGVKFSVELFKEAIIRHHGKLPTKTEHIKLLLKAVKPEEVAVEVRNDLDDFPRSCQEGAEE